MTLQRKNFLILFIISYLFAACAQQVAPTGGPKDVEPPEILKTTPKNNSLNFKGQEIEIEFNEFVKLQQINKELLVSPPLKYNVKTQLKGKTLNLKIKDTLKENTTYVFNFGKSIVDITENNPIDNYQYVFSTGDQIDSLSIAGRVVDAFSLKIEEDILVLLHQKNPDDSTISKQRPNYVGRSDKNGLFKIQNIKAGEYELYALDDKNDNYLFDAGEKIAFHSKSFKINEANKYDSLKLYLFEKTESNQFIKDKKETGPTVKLQFNRPLIDFNFQLEAENRNILKYYEINENQESATFWFKQFPKRKIEMVLSDGSSFNDTLNLTIDSLKPDFKLELTEDINSQQPYYKPIKVKFNHPIASYSSSKIKLLDSDSTMVQFEVEKDTISESTLYLHAKLKQDSSYKLSIEKGAFTNYYGQTNDSIFHSLAVNNTSDYSQIEVVLKTSYKKSIILQLITTKGEVIKSFSVKKSKPTIIEHLKAGSYRLKLIFDENNNQKWDSGDFYKGIAPEKVWVYEEDISLRKNWDREIKWVIEQDRE